MGGEKKFVANSAGAFQRRLTASYIGAPFCGAAVSSMIRNFGLLTLHKGAILRVQVDEDGGTVRAF